MKLDRWIALLCLIGSLVYGFAAFNFPLLPFERNMAFLPNTLPMALSVLGVLLSLIILFSPQLPVADDDEPLVLGAKEFKQFELGQAFSLVGAMVLYALLLRAVGFLLATTLFISGASVVLGERRFLVLIPVAVIAAFSIWYLVQQTLGIYLRPWPAFLGH